MPSLKHFQSKINELSSVIFLSHGAGPLPLLKNTGHEEMVRSLRQMGDW